VLRKKGLSRKQKVVVGVAAGAAAVAGLVAVARKMHQKGYERKALNLLKSSAKKIDKEARAFEKKIRSAVKKTKKKAAKKSVKRKPKKKSSRR